MKYTVKVTAGEISRTDGDTHELVEVSTEVKVSSTSHAEAEAEAIAEIGDWIRAYWRAEEHGETLAEPDRWQWEADGEVMAGVVTKDMDVEELRATAIDCEAEGYDPKTDW